MKFSLSIVGMFLVVAVVVAGCGSSGDSSGGSSEPSIATESTIAKESTAPAESSPSSEKPEASAPKPVPTTDKKKPKVTVPKNISPNKLRFVDLEKGSGPAAKSGDTVTIHYVVVGYDSEQEVDSSWGRGPYTFTIGSGEALKGGEIGVEGMKVGGRRELIIPGKLAYGPEGYAPEIGPNETLVMVVDLLAIE